MQKRMLILLSAVLLMFLTGSAMANRFDSFEATADCDGWLVNGAAKIGQADRPGVDISYTVSLTQNGSVLDEQTGTIFVRALMNADPFSVSGSFDNLPAGTFEISGVFTLPFYDTGEVEETFTIEMTCGNAVTTERPAFWRHHPELWPVDTVEVGGVTYSKNEARDMMRGCFRHRVVKRLFRHTLAAKLNAANGVAGLDMQLLADCDAYLASHNFHSRLPRSERREARRLKNEIRQFNRDDSRKSFESEDKDFNDYDDEATLDQMKAMFR